MKLSTRQIVTGGILLALMIVSQFFKNLSVFITGPIINAILIIATLSLGLVVGIILSVIAPVTSFLVSGSPIIAGIPLVMPAIMFGNIILCTAAYIFYKRITFKGSLPVGLIIGSVCKFAFMGAVIVKCLLPAFSANIKVPAEKLAGVLAKASTTFSVTQLITALTGSALAFIIWAIIGKHISADSNL